jgi:tRNA (guanine37-N1)-methyltransferase
MVMQIAPFHEALVALHVFRKDGKKTASAKKTRVIMTSASGKPFTQQDAKRLCAYDRLVFLCGRYEGIDERVTEHFADESFSVGPYVLTGGELPALIMTDAIARLRPGVLGKEASLEAESHTEEGVLEYPQYTRPEVYKAGKQEWKVPEVLLSGNHAEIAKWREGKKRKM